MCVKLDLLDTLKGKFDGGGGRGGGRKEERKRNGGKKREGEKVRMRAMGRERRRV